MTLQERDSLLSNGYRAGLKGKPCEAPTTRELARGTWETGWRAGNRDRRNKPLAAETHIEVWYEIESSLEGENDWHANGSIDYDTLESAKRQLDKEREDPGGRYGDYEYRIVRKTVTTEPVEG